ncbi:MAG TPA: MtnX-like HAD-IB family phosphatase [Pyrinomonadaceae bacterium]|jgi:2,3-diketo-5-methylthio-1-phosphopentane phosphatase|nr:MtnX-like HAD-IB family phosphatase [Pyrinomonadaceae bacterium]
MPDASPKSPILFLDFDGTISERDAIDALLEAFAAPEWLAVEAEWQAGRIGSRECLRAQMALVRAAREEVNALLDSIKVDRGFAALLETCAARRVPVHVVSDGFDYCIRRILANAGPRVACASGDVRVYSSRLTPEGGRWHVEFPYFAEGCAHGCATCKPAVMRRLNRAGARTVFVGDGLSDRYAAESADLVFAKGKLADYCRAQSIAHVFFEDLGKVASYLESLMRADALDADEAAQAVEA